MNASRRGVYDVLYRNNSGKRSIFPPVMFHGTNKEYLNSKIKKGFYQKSSKERIWCSQELTIPLAFAAATRDSDPSNFAPSFLIIDTLKSIENSDIFHTDNGYISISKISTNSYIELKIKIPNNYEHTEPNELLKINKKEIIRSIKKSLNLDDYIKINFKKNPYSGYLSPNFKIKL